MQKLGRRVIGTQNIDSCSRYCQSPATTGLFARSGTVATPAPAKILARPRRSSSSGLICRGASGACRVHKLFRSELIVADPRENGDEAANPPAYKERAVKMRVLSQKGDNPLKLSNFRYNANLPQMGVEMERKWKRSDYHFPGTLELVTIQTHK
jgi:predicted molibdopterin-dependent oxidoreductase YjgC